jgi:ABC-type sugar transport system substrate-binding protein
MLPSALENPMQFSTKPVRALISLITKENDYQRAHAASAEAVAQHWKVALDIIYANSDPVNQVQQILSAIQRPNHGIDIIIAEPAGTGMASVAETAAKMGIAWCVMNLEADYLSRLRSSTQAVVFEASVDQVEVGRIQAQQIAALLPQGGNILYLTGPAAGTAAARRTEGMLSRKPANIQLKHLTGNWTEEGAHRVVSSWLKLSTSKGAGFSAVISQNDAMAMGARQAFKELSNPAERSHWLSLPFLGCDGLPDTGQQYVHRKELAATVVTPAIAGIALETYMRARQEKKTLPERHLVQPQSFPAVPALRPLAAPAPAAR